MFLNQYLPSRILFLLFSESLLILGAFQLAAILKSTGSGAALRQEVILGQVVFTLICQLCLYYCDLYDLKTVKDARGSCVHLLQALGICSVLVGAIYLLRAPSSLDAEEYVETVFILFGLLVSWRIAFFWLCRKRRLRHPTLILGTGELAKKLASEILSRPDAGVRIVGFVSDDPSQVGKALVNPGVIGHTSELTRIVERERINEVIVAMPESRGSMPISELLDMKIKGVSIQEATTRYEEITGKIALENLRPSWLVFSQGFKKSRLALLSLRMMGIFLSVLGLVLAFPIIVVIAILVKLDSKGPVLFKQARVGKNGKTFQLWKFRSMVVNAEEKTGPIWAKEDDDRVTRVGRILRKVRLDELPQFINVLRGDMNFVGPRPERPEFVEELSKQIPYYNQRHTVRPGITGWAQVRHQYGGSVGDTIEKLQYDLFYIKNMSMFLDLYIIFQTIKIVMLGRGAH
jgi:sugar transferase (PEP-CTERM system associated)